jgi:hypothetical protein
MANTARKSKAESAQKTVKSRKAAKPDLLRLEADQRIDMDDPWSRIAPIAADDVAAISDAFERNRTTDTTIAERIASLEAELELSGQTAASDAQPAASAERADAARHRIRELLSASPGATNGPDERVSRTAIRSTPREMDEALENHVREIVRETLNEMLAGDTGAKLSAGIRRMVRREVEQLLALERSA